MTNRQPRHLAGRALRWLVAVAVVAALGLYVYHARRQLAAIFHLDPRYVLPMLAVPLLTLAVNGYVGRDLAAEFGVKLTPSEWYGLAVVNSLANYLPLPQAGAAARGVYLKRAHNLPYTSYAATLLVTYVSAVALYGVLGLSALTALSLIGRPSPPILWLIFAALTASLLLFTPLARKIPLPLRLAGFSQSLATLRRHHLLAKVVLLQAAVAALTTTGLWLACRAIPDGRTVSWLAAAMLGLMVLASGIVNLTPGNLGVEQFVAMATADLLHVAPTVGFLASALFRAISLLTVLALAPAFTAILARKHKAPPRSGVFS